MTHKTHDYTHQTWGHAVTVISLNGLRARVLGFGYGVNKDDYLLLPNGAGSTRYQIEGIEWKNPSDCWAADIVFSPRRP